MSSSSSSSVPATSSMSSLSNRVIWSEDEVRRIFQNKLWPEYVGNQTRVRHHYNYSNDDTNATLPVILWNEQIPIYDDLQSGITKKRKLDVESSSDCNEIDSSESKNKNLFSNPSMIIQANVFKELHNKGYFVGPGDIYGGDYGLYKDGDPSNSHSVATVRLILPQSSRTSRSAIKDTIIHSNDTTERADTIKSTNESTDKQIISSDIKPQVEKVSSSSIEVPNTINISNIQRPVISVKELLAFSRVQNHVAKNTVLAFYNPDSKEIGFLMTNFLYVSDRLA